MKIILAALTVLVLSGLISASYSSSSSEEHHYRLKINSHSKKISDPDDDLNTDCSPFNMYILGLQTLATQFNYTDDDIKHHVEGLCSISSDKAKIFCMDLFRQFKTKFFKLYRTHTADEVAQAIGLCRNQEKRRELDLDFKLLVCAGCRWGIGQLKSMVGHNVTPNTVVQSVIKYCDTLPSPFSSVCKKHVPVYLFALFDVAVHMDADDACDYIGACPSF